MWNKYWKLHKFVCGVIFGIYECETKSNTHNFRWLNSADLIKTREETLVDFCVRWIFDIITSFYCSQRLSTFLPDPDKKRGKLSTGLFIISLRRSYTQHTKTDPEIKKEQKRNYKQQAKLFFSLFSRQWMRDEGFSWLNRGEKTRKTTNEVEYTDLMWNFFFCVQFASLRLPFALWLDLPVHTHTLQRPTLCSHEAAEKVSVVCAAVKDKVPKDGKTLNTIHLPSHHAQMSHG